MRSLNRTIHAAIEKSTGNIIDANEYFKSTKEAFDHRDDYQSGKTSFECWHCGQDLSMSYSVYDRVFFKHLPFHDECPVSEFAASPLESEILNDIIKAKESPRHKELKNKIGKLLKDVNGVIPESVTIDNKFIMKESGKRRPDVYCKYKNKEIVFEIQLSKLSLRYILSRYYFYKEHGIYLMWILDNFDKEKQGGLGRDIKYLTPYQNLFKLDEKFNEFRLWCDYKKPYITEDNDFHTVWNGKSLALNELKFDKENLQIYYYNLDENTFRIKHEIKRREHIKRVDDQKENAEIEKKKATEKAKFVIDEIRRLKNSRSPNYGYIMAEIRLLSDSRRKTLNDLLGLKSKRTPLLRWIKSAKENDYTFIDFLLSTNEIALNINERDSVGRSAFQAIIENNELRLVSQYLTIKLLERGFKFEQSDIDFFMANFHLDNPVKNKQIILFQKCNQINDRKNIRDVFDKYDRIIYTIESIKLKKIVGYNRKPNDFVWLANNAIQYLSKYWEYIELAFKHYGLWDELIRMDTKGTFAKKLNEFYNKMPRQLYDFDEFFIQLYPEIRH